MNITFTAKQMEKPDGMSLKAQIAWDYFGFSSGGWCCTETQDGSVIVTDEAGVLDDSGLVFYDDVAFFDWLEEIADEHLADDAADFLDASGWAKEPLLWHDVITAIKSTIEADYVGRHPCMTTKG